MLKKRIMKAIKTTYIVVIENEECRIPLVYSDVTFSQALKKAKFACPSGYFIREIRLPDKIDYEFWKLASHLVDSCTQTKS